MNAFRLSKDSRGNWRRQNLGVRLNAEGVEVKPTFTLGRDLDNARQRAALLELVWAAIVKECHDRPARWYPVTYQIALAVARGDSPIRVAVPAAVADNIPSGAEDEYTAMSFGLLREWFPFLDIRPASDGDKQAAARGAAKLAASAEREAVAAKTANRGRGQAAESLYVALRGYVAHLDKKYGPTSYARTQRNQVELLKRHVADAPLGTLTADRIEEILSHFSRRPASTHDGKPLAFSTCRNVLITFRAFLRWLDRSESYHWQMPRAFQFPRVKIARTAPDRVHSRRVFKRAELALLWTYAGPWERALLLLALNCGFSKAELATLQTAEVIRRKGVWHIRRERVKTSAYAEWVLWPETVEALAYLKTLKTDDGPFAVVSRTGRSLGRLTRGGNENSTIGNHWQRLLRRVREDHADFPALPFKCLRKTGANLIRRTAKSRATELAAMYLAHSPRVDGKDSLLHHYTDRPWALLHRALLGLRRRLDGMFAGVESPWVAVRHTVSVLKRQTVDALKAEGRTQKEIAATVGLHVATVGRQLRKGRKGVPS